MANPYFNATYYLTNNPDVFAAGINTAEGAWEHYVNHGAAESLAGATSRKPAPWFDAAYYLTSNPDLSTAGLTAGQLFEHFTVHGIGEGRAPSAGAVLTEESLLKYALANEDLLEAFDIADDATELTDAQALALASQFYSHGYMESRPDAPFEASVDPDNAGETFTLTAALDFANQSTAFINGTIPSPFRFTSANETVEALNGTLSAGDTLLDNSVHDADVLNVRVAATAPNFAGSTIQNIETINLIGTNGAGVAANLANVTGLKELTASGTFAAGIAVTNAGRSGATTYDFSGVTNAAGAVSLVHGVTIPTADLTITGGAGADTLNGGNGNDVINGGAGNDVINAGAGDNTVDGGAGNDVITATTGNNTITAGAGNDSVTVGSGNNTIDMGAGATETVVAGSGNNVITTAGTTSNTITLGNGDNEVTVSSTPGTGTTTLTVGAGDNTITIGNGGTAGTGITVNGDGNNTITSGTGTDTVNINGNGTNVISTGGGADTITITATNNAGVSTITAGAGADAITLTATRGQDTIVQGTGDSVAASATTLAGANIAAGDTITFGPATGVDVVTNFQAGAAGDVLDLVVSTPAVTAIGVAANALVSGTNYFLSGTFNAGTGAFAILADGTGADTLILQGYEGAGGVLGTNASAVVLVGVDSDDLTAANFM